MNCYLRVHMRTGQKFKYKGGDDDAECERFEGSPEVIGSQARGAE